jgi:hypothetical protein
LAPSTLLAKEEFNRVPAQISVTVLSQVGPREISVELAGPLVAPLPAKRAMVGLATKTLVLALTVPVPLEPLARR